MFLDVASGLSNKTQVAVMWSMINKTRVEVVNFPVQNLFLTDSSDSPCV